MLLGLDKYISERKKNKLLPCDSVLLTYLLNGGFEEKRFYQIYGKTHIGKTWFVLLLAKTALRLYPDVKVFCYDIEKAFTLKFIETLPKELRSRFFVSTCTSAEKVFNSIENIYKDEKNIRPFIILDSIAALATQEQLSDGEIVRKRNKKTKEIREEIKKSKVDFTFQKLSGKFFKKINTIGIKGWFFGINQTRKNIPINCYVHESDVITPGGEAWDFYSSIKIRISKTRPTNENNKFGIKLKTDKNKMSEGFTCFIDVKKDLSLEEWSGMQEILIKEEIIKEVSTGWYQYEESKEKFRWKELEEILIKDKDKILKKLIK